MPSEDQPKASRLSQLTLQIDPGPGADDEDRARLAERLREDLRELGETQVREVVRPVETSDLARGVDMAWGTLAVSIAPGLIAALLTTVQSWLSRHERSSITLESGGEKLVVTGSPSKDEQRLIEAWVNRHKA